MTAQSNLFSFLTLSACCVVCRQPGWLAGILTVNRLLLSSSTAIDLRFRENHCSVRYFLVHIIEMTLLTHLFEIYEVQCIRWPLVGCFFPL